MANWRPLDYLAEKYCIPQATLLNWKLYQYVTSSTVGTDVMLDEDSLINLLEKNKVEALNDVYIERCIQEKEAKRDVILAQLEDDRFLLEAVKPYPQLMQVVIRELGQLIADEGLRDIFLSVSLGQPMPQIAKRHGMDQKQLQETYRSILVKLSKNTGRIASLCNPPQNPLVHRYNTFDPLSIPLDDIMSFKASMFLKRNGNLHTVGDLLRHTAKFGWNSMLQYPGMGGGTYKAILDFMDKAGFIVYHHNGVVELSPDLGPWVI